MTGCAGEDSISTSGCVSVAASARQPDAKPAQLEQSELDDALAGCLKSTFISTDKEMQV